MGRSRLRRKTGVITTLYTAPPPGRVVVCLDEMGPERAKSFPGRQLVPVQAHVCGGLPGPAAGMEASGPPADGEALTAPYPGRTTANSVAFLAQVETWMAPHVERIYAIMDHLSAPRATDVLLVSLAHPRREFVFQPKSAPYLNLIAPGWKVLRALALKGRRVETWAEVCQAVHEATKYGTAHRHPFNWGRRRHQPRRSPGIGRLPKAA